MSSSVMFTGSGFYVQSAQQYTPGTVRVTYSSTPKASNPALASDALNPTNYTLSGPGPYTIVSISTVSGDPLSIDIVLQAPLLVGTWTVQVANVQTPASNPLTAPTAASFQVISSAAITPLSGGAINDDAEKVIRKHLSPALAGPNWDALIAAFAIGDDHNWVNARAAFDQLFISSASGSWLETRASDEGITKPTNVGMADDLFRKLVIKSSSNKVVHEAIREILEVFYGQDSLRAFVESTVDENYNLTGNPDLTWTVDEKQFFTHTFLTNEFSSPTTSKAVEVAFVLTKAMRDLGYDGFAIAFKSPTTGLNRVRIYSGSLGLGSFVRVTGGSAQNIFKFPSEITTYSGTITSGSGYTWTYTRPDQNTTRISLVIDTSTTSRLINLSTVHDGDYVLLGVDAQAGITGTFTIKNVDIAWAGTVLTQSFDIDQISFNSTALQLSNDAYRFYRPVKNSISAAGGRTVVVAQTQAGHIDISIPATTQAVNRGPKTAAYGRVNATVDISRLQRLPSGTATITTETAHNLTVDQQVLLDNIIPVSSRPFITPGNGAAFPSSFQYPAAHMSLEAETQAPPALQTENATATLLTNGQILFAGGYRTVATAYDGEKNLCNRYVQGSTATIIDGTEADGAIRHSHTWLATATLNTARQYHAASSYGAGAIVTGGLTLGPETFLTSCEQYTVNSWTAIASLTTARAAHQQIELDNGLLMVIGGITTGDTSLSSTEVYNGTSWSAGASMNLARGDFQVVKLSDGRLLAIGGRTLGWGVVGDAAVGNLTSTTEIYNGATWTKTGSMSMARALHRAVVLPGDYVLVVGGRGYRPTQPLSFTASPSLKDAELYDPTSGQWKPVRSAGIRRHGQVMLYLSNGKVVVVGGTSTTADDLTFIEQFDVATRSWSTAPTRLIDSRGTICGASTVDGTEVVVYGGNNGTITNTPAETLIVGNQILSAGGLNGQHRVTSIVDSTHFQIETTNVVQQQGYTSTFGSKYQGMAVIGGFWNISTGSRTANVTTLTLTFPSGITAHSIAIGDTVYVNSRTGAFGSGLFVVTAATETTISYIEVASDQGSISVVGSVSEDHAVEASSISVTATPQSINDPGPYIFDPVEGVSVTNTESITSGFELFANQHYEQVELVTGDDFPDAEGYIVFGFGTEDQSPPIKYLGKFKSGPTTTKLLLDYSFKFTKNYPIGSRVTLLSQKGAFVPEDPLVGGFWITASSAGRVAAEASVEAALAAGVNPDITIVYPGDRGLGGEGLPSHGTQKLSDKVAVFAGDDVSEEVQAARED